MTFIAFEGGEGVGKSTQVKLLIDRLQLRFPEREFIMTREPGGSPLAERVRDIIIHDAQHADGKTMFGLFAAARFDHIRMMVERARQMGKVVITDRFVGSSFAYQVYAQDNSVSREFFDAYMKELAYFPTLTLVLDMDPVRSQERIGRRATDQLSHFDSRALEFHQKLRDGYHEFCRIYADKDVVMIDADRPHEEVHEDIMENVLRVLP